jgi:hypothetical protein
MNPRALEQNHAVSQKHPGSLKHRPAIRAAATHESRPHPHTPTPVRPPQTGYYLLRLRLQYSSKGVRPLARIV